MDIFPSNTLVVTPRPHKGESAQGFLLRTTELNGYESPSDILRLAGLNPNEQRSVRLPISRLAPLYACTPGELKNIDYKNRQRPNSKALYSIHDHSLSRNHVQIKNPRFCPACVAEKGYIESFWDIKYSVACPVHGSMTIDRCDKCNRPISWARPTPLNCKCGHKLDKSVNTKFVSIHVQGVLELLYGKFNRIPLNEELLKQCGFPVEDLGSLSLQTLLGLIERISRLVVGVSQDEDDGCIEEFRAVEDVAGVFADWPHGLYRLLDEIGNDSDRMDYHYFGLRKQFEGFYSKIFKSNLPRQEIQFIYDAFIEFGKTQWKRSSIDKRLNQDNYAGSNLMAGITEAAKYMGVQPSTVRKLVKCGTLKPKVICNGNSKRMLFDLSDPLPKRKSGGESLSQRESAKKLGLPVSVLSRLKKEGVFKTKWLGSRLGSYHAEDVEGFKNTLLDVVPDKSISCERNMHDVIRIDEVMKSKTGAPENKANVISKILKGELRVMGNAGNSIGSILLNAEEVKVILNNRKNHYFKGLLVVDAAKILHCDPTVIPWLIESSYLESVDESRALRVSSESLSLFSRNYRSCAYLADLLGTSSRKIIINSGVVGAPLLYAKRKYIDSLQAFIKVADFTKLEKIYGAPLFGELVVMD